MILFLFISYLTNIRKYDSGLWKGRPGLFSSSLVQGTVWTMKYVSEMLVQQVFGLCASRCAMSPCQHYPGAGPAVDCPGPGGATVSGVAGVDTLASHVAMLSFGH